MYNIPSTQTLQLMYSSLPPDAITSYSHAAMGAVHSPVIRSQLFESGLSTGSHVIRSASVHFHYAVRQI